jgi:hypothetical protein
MIMSLVATRLAAAFALVMTAAPAFATPVPEPASWTLLGVGVAGAIIARRLRRRK